MTDLVNNWALYFFVVFIPIIILYLLKPKPKDLKIPSLMFIMDMEQRKKFRSFLRRILRDPLLLLQLAALAFIILAIANPFDVREETKEVDEDVVLVLDSSASMQVGSPARFEEARKVASSAIASLGAGDRVSIVLAEKVPVVVLKRGSKAEAGNVVSGLAPKATPTGLGGAILLASDIVAESDAARRIVVISDFSNYEGVDPLAAQKKANSEGIAVEFIKVGKEEENIGIISSSAGREANGCFMEVLVKNYANSEQDVTATFLLNDQAVDSVEKVIQPDKTDLFYLFSECSEDEYEASVALNSLDTMRVDDLSYSLIPKGVDLDVLLIRERGDSEHVKYALESIDGVTLSETYPPVYPQDFNEYDIVVFQEAKLTNILPGTFPSIRKYVEDGGKLVVLGFPDLASIKSGDLEEVLPVEPLGMVPTGGRPAIVFQHQILNDVDISEIQLNTHIQAGEKIGSITVAKIFSNPLVTLWDVSNGKVVYAGIYLDSSASDFHLKPSFPIFWYNLVHWLAGSEYESSTADFKTGDQLPIISDQRMKVITPSGDIVEGTSVVLDEAGFYWVEGLNMKVAASLVDEKESEVSYSIDPESVKIQDQYVGSSFKEEVSIEYYWILALVAGGLVLYEWFYCKRRGSL